MFTGIRVGECRLCGPSAATCANRRPQRCRVVFLRYGRQAIGVDRCHDGYFLDNELRWGPDWRSNEELLATYLNFAETAPGRAAAFAFLKNRHGDIAKLNAVWGTAFASWDAMTRTAKFTQPFHRTRMDKGSDAARQAAGEGFLQDCDDFLRQCAERYFRITAEAIKAHDPNHLNLGARFPFMPGRAVVEEAVKRVNVLSIGGYGEDPTARLRELDGFDVPILIGEFSFRAKDSGLPNTQGAGPLLGTQTDRANAYERYVNAALADPRVVGIHWYCWADEPREGRADGENSNFGLVNIHDEPYEVLVKKMTEVNGRVRAVRNGR